MNPASWAPELLLLAPGSLAFGSDGSLCWDSLFWLKTGSQGSVYSLQADMTGWPAQPPPLSSSMWQPQSGPPSSGQGLRAPGSGAVWGVGSVELWTVECHKPGKEAGGRKRRGDKMWRVEESEEGPALRVGVAGFPGGRESRDRRTSR